MLIGWLPHRSEVICSVVAGTSASADAGVAPARVIASASDSASGLYGSGATTRTGISSVGSVSALRRWKPHALQASASAARSARRTDFGAIRMAGSLDDRVAGGKLRPPP